jgi:hypothetical protein
LNRVFKGFKPDPSLEAPLAPAVRPRATQPAQNKRAKDLEERHKNWLLMRPDSDPTATPSLEELFSLPELGPDGQMKKASSPLKGIFKELDPQRPGKSKSKLLAEDDPSAKRKRTDSRSDEESSTDEADLPSGVKKSQRELKKWMGSDTSTSTPAPARSSWWNVFGLTDNSLAIEQEKHHKALIEQFQQILDGPRPASDNNAVLNAVNASGPSSRLPASIGGAASISSALSRPAGFDAHLGPVSPALAGNVQQDINAKALNSWNPLYTAPKTEPARTPPPTPNFEVPRRKFY